MISTKELRKQLAATYNKRETNEKRYENIRSFCSISRKGLHYNDTEKRILLYTTLLDDKIFAQLPGKESVNQNHPNLKDFRPKLQFADDSLADDTAFVDIWRIIDQIAVNNKANLPILASIIFRIQTMYGYIKTPGKNYYTELVNIASDDYIRTSPENLEIYRLYLPDEVWEKLEELFNDDSNPLLLKDEKTSFQAFIEYLDILVQNEDCKYALDKSSQKPRLKDAGRINTCGTILSIIYYYEGHISLADLLYRFKRGVATFRVHDYPTVTDNIVTL